MRVVALRFPGDRQLSSGLSFLGDDGGRVLAKVDAWSGLVLLVIDPKVIAVVGMSSGGSLAGWYHFWHWYSAAQDGSEGRGVGLDVFQGRSRYGAVCQ
ncbi:hypothetical protein GALMADRAFT_936809 [Galerina marginata CBS 339.88]|uniref:Uncharacterized protein n=1 Tax=Galerina marginata (strain CBS 339.88) TaxID=685588 RepID=A0A067SDE2_GALM3|nr:hypothetical protein GALMADRAFT_936809 [Galerina marginata CBS 339.88]